MSLARVIASNIPLPSSALFLLARLVICVVVAAAVASDFVDTAVLVAVARGVVPLPLLLVLLPFAYGLGSEVWRLACKGFASRHGQDKADVLAALEEIMSALTSTSS